MCYVQVSCVLCTGELRAMYRLAVCSVQVSCVFCTGEPCVLYR